MVQSNEIKTVFVCAVSVCLPLPLPVSVSVSVSVPSLSLYPSLSACACACAVSRSVCRVRVHCQVHMRMRLLARVQLCVYACVCARARSCVCDGASCRRRNICPSVSVNCNDLAERLLIVSSAEVRIPRDISFLQQCNEVLEGRTLRRQALRHVSSGGMSICTIHDKHPFRLAMQSKSACTGNVSASACNMKKKILTPATITLCQSTFSPKGYKSVHIQRSICTHCSVLVA